MNPKTILTEVTIGGGAMTSPHWVNWLHSGVENYVFYIGAVIVTLRLAIMGKEAYDKFVKKE